MKKVAVNTYFYI